MTRFLLALLLSAIAAEGLLGADLDFGGVTFDFQRLSDAKFRIPPPGEDGDLVGRAPWEAGDCCRLHHPKARLDASALAKIRAAVQFVQSNGVCRVVKPQAIAALAGDFEGRPLAEFVSAKFTRFVEMPDAEGGQYRLSLRYMSRHAIGRHSYYLVYFRRRGDGGRWVPARDANGLDYTAYPLHDEWGGWATISRSVTIPKGCEAVRIDMRIDGVGELAFRDVCLAKVAESTEDVSLVLAPHGALGGDFALSRGQPAGLGFCIRRNAKRAIDPFSCRFRLELPAGVELLGTSFGDAKLEEREPLPSGGMSVVFPPARGRGFQFDSSFSTWNRLIALLRTNLPEGDAGKARMTFLSPEGRALSGVLEIPLRVIGEIKAEKPKRYCNGVSTSGNSTRFFDSAADAAFARFMDACGVDWLVCCGFSPEELAIWRKAGIRRITPTGQLANGYYTTRNHRLRPAEDRFVVDAPDPTFGTKYDGYIAKASCPFSIIEERAFFMTNTVALEINAFAKGVDGMWANWEPYIFRGRGCGCAVCKEKFREWHAKTGGSLADFRSKVHGDAIKVLDRHVRAATGGESSLGLVPGVSWRTMASTWRDAAPSPEARPIDYAGDFRWMNPWGPYVGWDSDSPYVHQKRQPLSHFVVAKDIRLQTDRDYPAGRRPRLMAFPHGMQGLAWVTQPEWLEMALDSFFFNRWDAGVVYFFPQGLDARYWRAFANATTRAAKCEEFVLDGVPSSGRCRVEPVAEYASPCTLVTEHLPQYVDVPMLQHAAFDLGGARLVAVLNFWNEGEAFFSLCADDLADGRYSVADDAGTVYASDSADGLWIASELHRGIMLMVGAARTKAFFIRPASRADDAALRCSAREMREAYGRRRAALSAAAEKDAAR